MIEIKIEDFDCSKVNQAIETSELVYGSEMNKIAANAPVTSPAYIENKHLNNPIKNSTIVKLVQDKEIRGHLFLIERIFIFNGLQNSILVASDLVSKANFPGASLAIFRKAVQFSNERGIPLINFSNKDSDKIYTHMMKMEPVIELDFELSVPNLKVLFNGIAKQIKYKSNSSAAHLNSNTKIIDKNLMIRSIPEFDETINYFIAKLENEDIFLGKRNSEILNWRFNPSNENRYARILIIKKQEVTGYLVVCERVVKGIKILMIVDYLIWNLSKPQIKMIEKELKRSYSNVMAYLWCSNLNHKNQTLGKFVGFTIPKRLLPGRVKFYLSGDDKNFRENLEKTHLTLFDTDIL
jgi:hypothetical protein